jgi:hypothetical protein
MTKEQVAFALGIVFIHSAFSHFMAGPLWAHLGMDITAAWCGWTLRDQAVAKGGRGNERER